VKTEINTGTIAFRFRQVLLYYTTLLVVFRLYFLYHLIVSNITGISQLKTVLVGVYHSVKRTCSSYIIYVLINIEIVTSL